MKCLSSRQISKQIQTTRASSCVGEKKANNGCSTMRARKPLMRAWRLCGKSQGRGRGQSWCDPGLRSCAFSFPGPLLAVPRWLLEELFNAGWRNDPVGRGRSTGVSATRCEIRAGPERVPLHPLAWVLAALLGGIPYVLEGTFKNLLDSTFESMSGFTTTGATLLAVIEAETPSILFWRSMTHWLGGLGIVVLFVAVATPFRAGGAPLLRAGNSGPT